MKYAIILTLLPVVLSAPHDQQYSHHHHRPSGATGASSVHASAATGPFGLHNSTASQAGTAIGTGAGSAISKYSTAYETLESTIYQTAAGSSAGGSPSQAASAKGSGDCGGTVTVTNDNTVTITVGGGASASQIASSPVLATLNPTTAVSPIQISASDDDDDSDDTSSTPAVSQLASSVPIPVKPVAPMTEQPLSSSAPTSQAPVSKTPSASQAAVSSAPASQTPVSSAAASSSAASSVPVSQAPSSAPSSPASVALTGGGTATTPLCPAASSALAAAKPGTYKAPPSPPGSKRGLFIPVSHDTTTADYLKAFAANQGKISWIVNQFSGPPSEEPDAQKKFSYVPQCYDKFSDDSKPGEAPHPWTTNAQKAYDAGEKYFLSFGEANTPNDQGFTQSAGEAVQNFKKMLQPWADKGIIIGSPGTLAQCDDVTWQIQVLDQCLQAGCSIGFVAAHWFSPAGPATAQKLADTFWGTINQYKQIAQRFGLKVWVDNFSLDPASSEIQKEFFDIVVPQMDSDPMIERYGYVSATEESKPDGFINSDGSISDLGKHYAIM